MKLVSASSIIFSLSLTTIIGTPSIGKGNMIVANNSNFVTDSSRINHLVDELIQPLVDTRNYMGTIAIARGAQQLVNKSYGFQNEGTKFSTQADTKYFLASASMPFTALAVMLLADRGKLNLADKVSVFIPEYRHGRDLTIHELLSQRSGIPEIGHTQNVNYDQLTLTKQNASSLFEYFKDYDLLYTPGRKYNHGRSDYILLALIIERITGKNFGDFLSDEIFRPLGMKNTAHYTGKDLTIQNIATGYGPKDLFELEEVLPIDWSSKTGHASIYTTSGDMLRFGEAILEKRLLKEESWDKIFTDYGEQVGYGWFIRDHGSHKRFQMNGRSPGFSSYFAVYPEDELVVVMLSNVYISLPGSMGIPLASIVFGEEYGRLSLSDTGLSADKAMKFVGKYKFGPDFYRPDFLMTIRFQDGFLFSDWGGLIPLEGNAEKSSNQFILRAYWLDVRFDKLEENKAKFLLIDGFKAVRQD